MGLKILTLFSVLVAAEVVQQSLGFVQILPQIREEESPKPCYNRQGEVGECVQNYLCDRTTGTIIEDGSDVLDVRSQSNSVCVAPLVCCKSANNPSQDMNNVRYDPSIPVGIRQQRDVTKQGCGWRNENGVITVPGAITAGYAKPGEFPWMSSILRRGEPTATGQKSYTYVGGAFLIHEKVALTAAHVVAAETNPGLLYVVVGNYDGTNVLPKVLKRVQSLVLHEQYQKDVAVNDIALVIIKKPVQWQSHIGYICLPPLNAQVTPGSRCFASGWGDDAESVHQFMQGKAELPVISRDACQSSLRTTDLGRFFELNESFMCAGGEPNKDTCKGGAGSPLACPIEGQPGRYMATGILSWGMSCGLDGIPSVYIDVARVRQWIDDKLALNGLSTASYSQY